MRRNKCDKLQFSISRATLRYDPRPWHLLTCFIFGFHFAKNHRGPVLQEYFYRRTSFPEKKKTSFDRRDYHLNQEHGAWGQVLPFHCCLRSVCMCECVSLLYFACFSNKIIIMRTVRFDWKLFIGGIGGRKGGNYWIWAAKLVSFSSFISLSLSLSQSGYNLFSLNTEAGLGFLTLPVNTFAT